ncbi:DinB family protein [Paenibacillus gallinarum]|uniref:DinB family protein n=1 Tax=Paenibacillus gallinarum TaxID=2762232 RepID=A0ABR8T1F2_9BACL|nr:DinB family protein [Paenibacillus gallinarum]MBD7969595.1 DinB family protein [Paenibacillus gallinarum]
MGNEIASVYEKIIEELVKYKEIDDRQFLEPISESKWSIREIIGHLLYWDKFILERHVPFMNDGGKLSAFPDHDSHNKEAIEYISVFETTRSLIDEFVLNRKLLIEKISEIESSAKFTIGKGKRQFTVDKYLKIFIEHDIHHLKQINDQLN